MQTIRTRIEMGAAGEGFVFGADGQALPAAALERLSKLLSSPLAEFQPMRLGPVAFQDLRGIELVGLEVSDASLGRFSIVNRGDSSALEELQRTLRSGAFANQLDRLRTEVREELQFDRSVTISVAGVSLGLSLVYVLWLIRGGVLMGSYLSALPAWRVLDPLPVLSRVDEEADEDDEALDAVSERSGNPLRGFG